MKVWRTATVSLLFGVFLYFVTLGELWFALIPVFLLVSFMIVSRISFKASSKAERTSILMIAVPFLLIWLAYFSPEDLFYAAPLGIASAVLLFVLLFLHEKRSIQNSD